jgi:hypothetical protein
MLVVTGTVALFGLVTLLSCYLSWYYAAEGVAPVTYCTSVLTWVLTFGLVLLVPMDVALSWYLPD